MLGSLAKPVHVPNEAAHWSVRDGWCHLDTLCNGIFDCPHTTPNLSRDGPYVVRSQDIRTGIFRLSEAGRVSEETYQERIARAEPQHGDLLYSREGTYFGIAAEVPAKVRVCLGQRMVLIRPDPKKLDFRFLRYWLNSPLMARHIEGFRDGTVAERLNMPVIRALPVPALDRNLQTAIGLVLGALDDKIELNRRMNETLEATARAFFNDWFIDFGPSRTKMDGRDSYLAPNFWCLFPDRLDEEGKPEGWTWSVLGDHVTSTKGASYSSSELSDSETALVTLKSFERGGGYRRDGLKSYTGKFKPEQVVRDGELIVAHTDVTQAADVIGRPARVLSDPKFRTLVASLDIGIVRPASSSHLTRTFLQGLLGCDTFRQHTYAHSTGTTVLHLSKNAIPTYEFILPSSAVLQAFETVVRPLREKQAVNTYCADSLADLRNLLLPKLMSGEIRIKDAEKIVGEVA